MGEAMTLCWKCKNPSRVEGALFCALCGAAQRAGTESPASREWRVRLSQVERPPSWGLAFLWLIAWPIAPLSYPVFLVKATRRLRRHVAERVRAPALASPRFTDNEEGRRVELALAESAGKLNRGGAFPAFLSFALLTAIALTVFGTAANAPPPIRFGDAVGRIVGVRPARQYVPVYSSDEYERLWYRAFRFTRAEVQASPARGSLAVATYQPAWSPADPDTFSRHRPYEYVQNAGAIPWVYRVLGVTLLWEGTETAGAAFWTLLGLLYLLYTGWGLVFWTRFARHARAEAVAAAYARGDVEFHDRLVAAVERRNTLLLVTMTLLSILPLFFWHVILFPLSSAVAFARHTRWERRTGVAAALGIVRE